MEFDDIMKAANSLGGIDGIISSAKGLKGIFKKDSKKLLRKPNSHSQGGNSIYVTGGN